MINMDTIPFLPPLTCMCPLLLPESLWRASPLTDVRTEGMVEAHADCFCLSS